MPRIIQTYNFVMIASGLNLDIEPNEITNPKGTASTNVTKKITQFLPKPCNNTEVMSKIECSIILRLRSPLIYIYLRFERVCPIQRVL